MISNLLLDLRAASRGLARRPGYTLAALATVALAVGANTAVFSVVRPVLLRPLPFAAPDSVVAVWPARFMSYRDLAFLREHTRTLAGLGGMVSSWNMTLTGEGNPTQLTGARVTANLFEVLGAPAALGRTFRPEEGLPGGDRVVVLSHAVWRTRFGADSGIIGRRLTLDGEPHTVVGVMGAGFELVRSSTQVWRALAIDQHEWYFQGGGLFAIGRLAPGSSLAGARAELRSLAARLRETYGYPDEYGADADLVALGQQVVGYVRPLLLVIAGAVGFVLLIAGANLAGLLFARAAGREREMAVRVALGAGRARLARFMLVESLLLSMSGGAAGVAFAGWTVGVAARSLADRLPRGGLIRLDMPVLLSSVGLALGIGLLFGILPAVATSRIRPQRALAGGRGAGGGGRLARLPGRGPILVVQVALGMILVVGTALMVQTLWWLARVNPGFRSDHVLTLGVQGAAARPLFFEQVFQRVGALPGVTGMGAIQHLPLGGGSWSSDVEIEGRSLPVGATPPRVGWRVVGGEYFGTLGIPVMAGRPFTGRDDARVPPVVVINQRMARQLWPGESALGRRLRAVNATGGEWATVIGVVGDVRHEGLDQEPPSAIYRPLRQYPHSGMTLVIRTAGDPLALAGSITDAVWSVSADVPITGVRSLDSVLAASVADRRLVLQLLACFALVGLATAAVGVYGVVSFSVGARTREIGIRIALGAEPASVVGGVLREGVSLAAVGVVAGTVGALALGRSLQALVYGVVPRDPLTIAAAAFTLMAVSLLASYLPARRAARADPMEALRAE